MLTSVALTTFIALLSPLSAPPNSLDYSKMSAVGEPIAIAKGQVRSVAFSSTAKILVIADEKIIRLWNVGSSAEIGYAAQKKMPGEIEVNTHTMGIEGATLSGNAIVSVSGDKSMLFWNTFERDMNTSSGELGKTFPSLTQKFTDKPQCIAAEENITVVGFRSDGIQIFDGRTLKRKKSNLAAGSVTSVALAPRGFIGASGLDRGAIELWDSVDSSKDRTLTGHTDSVNGLGFCSNGSILASVSSDNTVRLWDVATGKQIGSPLTGHTDKILAIACVKDSSIFATAGADKTIRIWNAKTGMAVGVPLTGHTDAITSLAFSPDGKLLASGSKDKTVRLWKPA